MSQGGEVHFGEHRLGNEATHTVKERWIENWQVIPHARSEAGRLADVEAGSDPSIAGWQLTTEGDVRKRVLAFRGLRVRIGMSCGFEAGDVALNKTTSRTQYSGVQAAVARGVCDAAQVMRIIGNPIGSILADMGMDSLCCLSIAVLRVLIFFYISLFLWIS